MRPKSYFHMNVFELTHANLCTHSGVRVCRVQLFHFFFQSLHLPKIQQIPTTCRGLPTTVLSELLDSTIASLVAHSDFKGLIKNSPTDPVSQPKFSFNKPQQTDMHGAPPKGIPASVYLDHVGTDSVIGGHTNVRRGRSDATAYSNDKHAVNQHKVESWMYRPSPTTSPSTILVSLPNETSPTQTVEYVTDLLLTCRSTLLPSFTSDHLTLVLFWSVEFLT